jgi:hypothetical protein
LRGRPQISISIEFTKTEAVTAVFKTVGPTGFWVLSFAFQRVKFQVQSPNPHLQPTTRSTAERASQEPKGLDIVSCWAAYEAKKDDHSVAVSISKVMAVDELSKAIYHPCPILRGCLLP